MNNSLILWFKNYVKYYVKLSYIYLYFTDTAVSDIEDTFKRFIKRDDIDIILINQNVSIYINKIIYIYIIYYFYLYS